MRWSINVIVLELLVTACGSFSNHPTIETRIIEKTGHSPQFNDISKQVTSQSKPEVGISPTLEIHSTENTPKIPGIAPTLIPSPVVGFSPEGIQNLPEINPENVSRLTEIEVINFAPQELVTALRWSPDGKILAAAVGDELQIYRAGESIPAAVYPIDALTPSVDFSLDSGWVAAGSKDGNVRIFNVKELMERGYEKLSPVLTFSAHKKGVNSLDFNETNVEMLATGGNDAVARFWEIPTGTNLGLMIGGTFAVPAISFSPDGSYLAVINGDTLRIRQVGTESILGSFLSDSPLYCVVYSPDGNILAAGDLNNRILLWYTNQAFRSGSEQYPQPEILVGHEGLPNSPQSLIWNLAFNPVGNLLVSVGGDGTLRIWDVAKKDLLTTRFSHTRGATSAAIHPSGKILVTGGLDGSIRFWGITH